MPLVRISLGHDRWPGRTPDIVDAVYEAMCDTFAVPENDRFMLVTRHGPGDMVVDPTYMGLDRSDDVVIVQIVCNDTRTLDQKKALYAAIARNLGTRPGVRPDDVFINLVEVKPENWSFGRGLAQYA